MSTPNPLTRIEREAQKYESATQHDGLGPAIYKDGAIAEHARAAPVVKALEKMYKDYYEFMTYRERLELKQILETYKADV